MHQPLFSLSVNDYIYNIINQNGSDFEKIKKGIINMWGLLGAILIISFPVLVVFLVTYIYRINKNIYQLHNALDENGNIMESANLPEDLKEAYLKVKSGIVIVPHQRPYVRFFARLIDIVGFSYLANMVLAITLPEWFAQYFELTWIFLPFIYVFLWIFVEALLLSTWGTTPGKWFMSTTVREEDDHKLSYHRALKRSFAVWVKGIGCNIPLFWMFGLLAKEDLMKNGATGWDEKGGFKVVHQEISNVRETISLGLLIYFLKFFNSPLDGFSIVKKIFNA